MKLIVIAITAIICTFLIFSALIIIAVNNSMSKELIVCEREDRKAAREHEEEREVTINILDLKD